MHARNPRRKCGHSPKNADPEEPDPLGEKGNLVVYLGLLGEAVGGHGVPLGETPAELPSLLPAVEGDVPEFEEPEFEPESDEPVFGAEEPEVPAVPGNVPHGEPLGLVPGVFEAFGFTVEGCVLLPGVAGFVELEPGAPEGELGVALPGGGVAVPAGGVAVLAGGVAGLAGGVAECGGGVAVPGACDCPAAELPAGAAPPAGALCATTQVAHKSRTDKKASFFADMRKPSLNFLIPFTASGRWFGNLFSSSVCSKSPIEPIGRMP